MPGEGSRELDLVDVQVNRIGKGAASGDTVRCSVMVTLKFAAGGDEETVAVSGLSGTYRQGSEIGFLFSGDSLKKLQEAVYARGISRLWVGSFWAGVARYISDLIEEGSR